MNTGKALLTYHFRCYGLRLDKQKRRWINGFAHALLADRDDTIKTKNQLCAGVWSVPEGTRTPDLLFRRQSLYPLSYRHICGLHSAYNNGGFWRLCQD